MTTETTPTPEDAIRAAVDAITAPPPPDPAGLLDLVGQIRATHRVDDPKSIYFGRRDLVERDEREIATLMARHSIREAPPPSPLEIAQRRHEAAFSHKTPPALQAMLDERTAAIEAQGRVVIERATAELRSRLTPKEHDRLADLARAAYPGAEVPRAVFADEHLLRCAAADGAFARARERTRPR